MAQIRRRIARDLYIRLVIPSGFKRPTQTRNTGHQDGLFLTESTDLFLYFDLSFANCDKNSCGQADGRSFAAVPGRPTPVVRPWPSMVDDTSAYTTFAGSIIKGVKG